LGIRILSKSNYLLGFSAKHKESKGYLQTWEKTGVSWKPVVIMLST
jgi:hypothetical protein